MASTPPPLAQWSITAVSGALRRRSSLVLPEVRPLRLDLLHELAVCGNPGGVHPLTVAALHRADRPRDPAGHETAHGVLQCKYDATLLE